MNTWAKPKRSTKFHIDAEWWDETSQNFRVHLLSHLCSDWQEQYKDYHEADLIDWIDAFTGEVSQVDGLWHSLRVCCSKKPDYINDLTPLTTAVFGAPSCQRQRARFAGGAGRPARSSWSRPSCARLVGSACIMVSSR